MISIILDKIVARLQVQGNEKKSACFVTSIKKLHVIQSLGGLFLVLVDTKVLFSVEILGNIFLMVKDTLGALSLNDSYHS